MAGSVKHIVRRGDNYWARIVVPLKLRPMIGKTELREPLGPNRKLAERHLHPAVARMHDRLAEAERQLDRTAPPSSARRARPLSLSEIAQTHYGESLEFDDELRNTAPAYSTGFADKDYVAALRDAATGRLDDQQLDRVVGHIIRKFQRRGSLTVEEGTAEWRATGRTLAAVELEALSRHAERDDGDFAGQPTLPILTATADTAEPRPPKGEAVSILDLLAGYLKELRASGKGAEAERRWTPCFKGLVQFLGHDDARHLSKGDVIKWKDHLLDSGLSAKTVRDTNIASLKAVLQWAADNERIPSNPAAGVKVRVTEKPRNREKGFNDAEAHAVLKAASEYVPPTSTNPQTRESDTVAAAKRWLPWLCAFTGARVAEMAQLRKEDVQEQGGITFVRITPEAGSVKTGEFRDVPVHVQLVELGFLRFVESANPGPLFYDGTKQRTGKQHIAKRVAARVSTWVRSLDVISPEVDPSHAWRHRFKSLTRDYAVDAPVADALQGHAPRTAGEEYGSVSLRAKAAAIAKLPHYAT
jgi:integrase